jgi:IclR family acetate operon transcriptional repressor
MPKPQARAEKRHIDMSENVKTAGRTLDLFEVFARKRGPLSLSELAKAIDSPVSSTHALVKTLRARGFVYVLEDRKLIYPTKRILSVAQLIAENDPIVELMLPILTQLQRASDETVILGKRQGDRIIYLEVVESNNSIRYSARPGDTKPLHSSSIGKAMLSTLPDAEIAALVKKAGQKKVTANTITDTDRLIADIAAARAGNTYITRGENVVDVMAMAVPVNVGGEPFGIAIAGPMPRMLAREADFARLLTSTVASFAGGERESLSA